MLKSFWENKDMAKQIEIENKSDVTLHGLKPGAKTLIKVDRIGTPLDKNWRRRMKDSEIDGCIEVVEQKKAKESKKKAD